MHVIMNTGLSGPDKNLQPGDAYEPSDEEGQRLIDAGLARLPDAEAPAPVAAKVRPGRRRA